MISPQQIAYILAVSETGSVSRAAEQCFVTQPTLSMQLKKAEEVLGHLIFHRDTNSMELTEFGKALIPVLQQIQGDFGAIDRIRQIYSGTYQERLRIGVIPTVAAYLLLDNFQEWQSLLPTTQVFVEELKTEELLEALDQRKVDMAILAGPITQNSFRVTPLFTEEILAYAPSIEGEILLVDQLKDLQPWLLNKGNCLRTQMMQFCSINDDLPSSWNYQGGNMDLLMRMVDQQGGYTLIPEYYHPFVQQTAEFKSIRDDQGSFPGRSIIAVSAFRHANWDSMEKIIRSIQHKYSKPVAKELELLSWK
ncbi:LysR family transcriptional regulator [Fluviicola sp.]|uniref:LysR family transcriptional regulator n=1 Tax=Fluviicola sp. TaxID=1917219 RepID=UPI0026186130|nr:LysR family transcriptional regulator [Fluviicola sp.]